MPEYPISGVSEVLVSFGKLLVHRFVFIEDGIDLGSLFSHLIVTRFLELVSLVLMIKPVILLQLISVGVQLILATPPQITFLRESMLVCIMMLY